MIILDNVPNQRWVTIKFCLSGRRAMIFLNDKLEVADIIPGVPMVQDRELVIGVRGQEVLLVQLRMYFITTIAQLNLF